MGVGSSEPLGQWVDRRSTLVDADAVGERDQDDEVVGRAACAAARHPRRSSGRRGCWRPRRPRATCNVVDDAVGVADRDLAAELPSLVVGDRPARRRCPQASIVSSEPATTSRSTTVVDRRRVDGERLVGVCAVDREGGERRDRSPSRPRAGRRSPSARSRAQPDSAPALLHDDEVALVGVGDQVVERTA